MDHVKCMRMDLFSTYDHGPWAINLLGCSCVVKPNRHTHAPNLLLRPMLPAAQHASLLSPISHPQPLLLALVPHSLCPPRHIRPAHAALHPPGRAGAPASGHGPWGCALPPASAPPDTPPPHAQRPVPAFALKRHRQCLRAQAASVAAPRPRAPRHAFILASLRIEPKLLLVASNPRQYEAIGRSCSSFMTIPFNLVRFDDVFVSYSNSGRC